MSTFPGSPRLLKGAIIGVDPLNPLAESARGVYKSQQMRIEREALEALADRREGIVYMRALVESAEYTLG